MRRTSRAAMAVSFGIALLTALSVPATSLPGDGGDENENGYQVTVTFTGDAAPDGDGGGTTVYIPPLCYWGQYVTVDDSDAPDIGDGTDMQQVLDYVEWFHSQPPQIVAGWAFFVGPQERYEDAVEREEAGADLRWYSLYCEIELSDERAIDFAGDQVDGYALAAAVFEQTEEPPVLIDPEDLAEEAQEHMVIEPPEVERNPRMVGTLAGATLVNMPTYFWVTNPEESVGGPDGERSIRAEVVGGDVWAEVTAGTKGLTVDSPAGNTFCDPDQASVAWSIGVDEDSGCTVQFSQASIGYPDGYPVSASTLWTATWEGETQDGEQVRGEDLDPLSRADTVEVPVAEIQSIVGGGH